MINFITSHTDLIVFQSAFHAAVSIHEHSMKFPSDEKYAMTDQIRRSSRSVAANLAEAYRKRRYPKAFISKLMDSEGEAAETQVWLRIAHTFHYLNDQDFKKLNGEYSHIINQIVKMLRNPEKWSFYKPQLISIYSPSTLQLPLLFNSLNSSFPSFLHFPHSLTTTKLAPGDSTNTVKPKGKIRRATLFFPR